MADEAPDPTQEWHKTVCVLCSNNCGVEIRLDERRFTRVRGNKAHIASKGYTCEKALRLDHYQNARSRLTSPMRRTDDGSYVEVDWDTAIEEIATGLRGVIDTHGADKILYYGGGGQGNHLCGAYGAALRNSLGITRKSNALAQEKTGEAWVEGRMYGTHTHGEFHEAEVSIFLGKNPWHSHGFDEARRVLKEIAAADDRTMVVIDPRRTETADLADHWYAVKPGTDAFFLAALLRTMFDVGAVDGDWLASNAVGVEAVEAVVRSIDVDDCLDRCGIDAADVTALAERIGRASSVSIFEDLGIEMGPHSTLVSYLQRLVTALAGSVGVPGGMTAHTALVPLFSYGASGKEPLDPVTGGPLVSGLIPCNEIAEGVLSDHPERTRAMFIESANPVHSLAGSAQFRKAMREIDLSVVIDVAMTETALEADWVLPAASQYEKVETTFFSMSFPENRATVRPPVLEPLSGTLPEPEIHVRLLRALGVYGDDDLAPLHEAFAAGGYAGFGEAFLGAATSNPTLAAAGAAVLYEVLGPSLPEGMAGAAPLWFSCQQLAMRFPKQVAAAGHDAGGADLGTNLFEALISNPDGVVFTKHEHGQSLDLLRTADQKINVAIPELLELVARLGEAPRGYTTDDFPYVLSAGERRGFTANTIIRDPAWRKKDPEGALRISPADAATLGIDTGQRVRITTAGGTAVAVAEVNETMQDGHISLPNGMGLGYAPAGGEPELTGVAPNELTSLDWKDPIVGTPWHKHVPARLEPVA